MDPTQRRPPPASHSGGPPRPQLSWVPAGRSASSGQPTIPRPILQMSQQPFGAESFHLQQTEVDFWATPVQDSHQPSEMFLPPPLYLVPNISPCVLVPFTGPVPFRYHPYSHPGPLFFCPEHHPSRYLCPQPVPVQQDFIPVLASSTPNINMINMTVVLPPAINQREAETRDEQQKVVQPESTEARGGNTEQDGREPQVSAGREPQVSAGREPQVSAGRELQVSAGRELQVSAGAPAASEHSEVRQKIKESEDQDELDREVAEDGSIIEYLNELCSDQNFEINEESIQNYPLPSDEDPFNVFDLETQPDAQ